MERHLQPCFSTGEAAEASRLWLTQQVLRPPGGLCLHTPTLAESPFVVSMRSSVEEL